MGDPSSSSSLTESKLPPYTDDIQNLLLGPLPSPNIDSLGFSEEAYQSLLLSVVPLQYNQKVVDSLGKVTLYATPSGVSLGACSFVIEILASDISTSSKIGRKATKISLVGGISVNSRLWRPFDVNQFRDTDIFIFSGTNIATPMMFPRKWFDKEPGVVLHSPDFQGVFPLEEFSPLKQSTNVGNPDLKIDFKTWTLNNFLSVLCVLVADKMSNLNLPLFNMFLNPLPPSKFLEEKVQQQYQMAAARNSGQMKKPSGNPGSTIILIDFAGPLLEVLSVLLSYLTAIDQLSGNKPQIALVSPLAKRLCTLFELFPVSYSASGEANAAKGEAPIPLQQWLSSGKIACYDSPSDPAFLTSVLPCTKSLGDPKHEPMVIFCDAGVSSNISHVVEVLAGFFTSEFKSSDKELVNETNPLISVPSQTHKIISTITDPELASRLLQSIKRRCFFRVFGHMFLLSQTQENAPYGGIGVGVGVDTVLDSTMILTHSKTVSKLSSQSAPSHDHTYSSLNKPSSISTVFQNFSAKFSALFPYVSVPITTSSSFKELSSTLLSLKPGHTIVPASFASIFIPELSKVSNSMGQTPGQGDLSQKLFSASSLSDGWRKLKTATVPFSLFSGSVSSELAKTYPEGSLDGHDKASCIRQASVNLTAPSPVFCPCEIKLATLQSSLLWKLAVKTTWIPPMSHKTIVLLAPSIDPVPGLSAIKTEQDDHGIEQVIRQNITSLSQNSISNEDIWHISTSPSPSQQVSLCDNSKHQHQHAVVEKTQSTMFRPSPNLENITIPLKTPNIPSSNATNIVLRRFIGEFLNSSQPAWHPNHDSASAGPQKRLLSAVMDENGFIESRSLSSSPSSSESLESLCMFGLDILQLPKFFDTIIMFLGSSTKHKITHFNPQFDVQDISSTMNDCLTFSVQLLPLHSTSGTENGDGERKPSNSTSVSQVGGPHSQLKLSFFFEKNIFSQTTAFFHNLQSRLDSETDSELQSLVTKWSSQVSGQNKHKSAFSTILNQVRILKTQLSAFQNQKETITSLVEDCDKFFQALRCKIAIQEHIQESQDNISFRSIKKVRSTIHQFLPSFMKVSIRPRKKFALRVDDINPTMHDCDQ